MPPGSTSQKRQELLLRHSRGVDARESVERTHLCGRTGRTHDGRACPSLVLAHRWMSAEKSPHCRSSLGLRWTQVISPRITIQPSNRDPASQIAGFGSESRDRNHLGSTTIRSFPVHPRRCTRHIPPTVFESANGPRLCHSISIWRARVGGSSTFSVPLSVFLFFFWFSGMNGTQSKLVASCRVASDLR